MTTDWNSFTKRIAIESTTWAIYNAWTAAGELEKWLLSSAEFRDVAGVQRLRDERCSAGDEYLWKWHGFAGGSPHRGRVLKANGYDRFAFSFVENSVVDISITSVEGIRLLTLEQTLIPDDTDLRIFLECGEGWAFYLTNLKSHLEGGIDLRNRNERITGVVNA